MMAKHGSELKKNVDVYIHSDQGSQYLSTTFKEMLEDDEFIQSVSRRGNSQDNAPMESFFGRMKTEIIDLIALCKDEDTAITLIENYIDDYNNKHYKYSLAGLTPAEFYTYSTSGIYPCESYYGVGKDHMNIPADLTKERLEQMKIRNEKDRERRKRQNEQAEAFLKDPEVYICRDKKKLGSLLKTWEDSKELAEKQIKHIMEIIEHAKEALVFALNADEDVRKELRYKHNWRKYKQLDYVFEMNEMF